MLIYPLEDCRCLMSTGYYFCMRLSKRKGWRYLLADIQRCIYAMYIYVLPNIIPILLLNGWKRLLQKVDVFIARWLIIKTKYFKFGILASESKFFHFSIYLQLPKHYLLNRLSTMDIFQLFGDILHFVAMLLLLLKIISSKNVIGLSYKTQ